MSEEAMSDQCPICTRPAVMICRCPLRDARCEYDHHWHRCPIHGVIVPGRAAHDCDTFTCRCANAKGDQS